MHDSLGHARASKAPVQPPLTLGQQPVGSKRQDSTTRPPPPRSPTAESPRRKQSRFWSTIHYPGNTGWPHLTSGTELRETLITMRTALKRAWEKWLEAPDGDAYARRFERTKSLRRHPTVSLSFEHGLYIVRDQAETLAVARKSRLRYQLYGLAARRKSLQAEYCIRDGLICPGDTVIDCGANIGEFSIIAAMAGARIVSFEPDRLEFTALKKTPSPAISRQSRRPSGTKMTS